MFRPLKKNDSGIVLVTVLIMVLVMSILTIGILGLNVSQVLTSEDVKRSLVAEYFARKILWTIQANILNNLLPIASSASEVIEGVVYTANIITGIPVEGEPTPYNIIVTYP